MKYVKMEAEKHGLDTVCCILVANTAGTAWDADAEIYLLENWGACKKSLVTPWIQALTVDGVHDPAQIQAAPICPYDLANLQYFCNIVVEFSPRFFQETGC